ncbi:hypothetical protein [Ekhidna sp.]|uniref:hypothetical protein n=1 Tax=Ekhidna sp. TaxID=2608089 RepID=UPI003B51146A
MFRKKAGKLLGAIFIVYVSLVATHDGEFWPFSIYPMFSQAGNPWARAVLRDVTDVSDSILWDTYNYPDLPGKPIDVETIGINQIDFSNFILKTQNWDRIRCQALIQMMNADQLEVKKLMACIIKGQLKDNSVEANGLPFIMLHRNEYYFNPTIDSSFYFKKSK